VSIEQIRNWNHLKTNRVAVGQRLALQVPYRRVAQARSSRKTVAHHATPQHTKVAAKKNTRAKTRIASAKTSSNTHHAGKNQHGAVTLASTK
jgi:hypothetical protein